MADISTLVTDIYKVLDQAKFEELSVHLPEEDRTDSKPSLRMSNLGRPLRQLYYDLTSAPNQENLSGKTRFKFRYGHLLEDLVLELAIRAGHDVRDRQKEISVDSVVGHIDAIVDDVLVDVKSCSAYSFEKFKSGRILDEDNFGYVYQLSGYWSCLDVDRAGFLAINKVDGELFFYELPADKRRDLDDVRSRISLVRDTVASKDEPQRCYEPVPEGKSGNLRLGVGCSYCPHKFHCYRDANDGAGLKTYYYSGGPKFLIKVAKEPRVRSDGPVDEFPTKEKE